MLNYSTNKTIQKNASKKDISKQKKVFRLYSIYTQTFRCFGIFPSASNLARACLLLIIRWYCLALTYNGSSNVSIATGTLWAKTCCPFNWNLFRKENEYFKFFQAWHFSALKINLDYYYLEITYIIIDKIEGLWHSQIIS